MKPRRNCEVTEVREYGSAAGTEDTLSGKYEKLKEHLASFGSLAVAFSGGVDSAFLLYTAREALGDKLLAVTVSSCFNPERELAEAREFCSERKIPMLVLQEDVLRIEGIVRNPKDRCYLCKRALFGRILAAAEENGLNAVAEGSNVDDTGDYRPGMKALAELGIRSPLRECGFTKQEIRALSKRFALPTWDKQSFACLASRFPYGEMISEEKLAMTGRAEQYLLDLGFRQLRVRVHESAAAQDHSGEEHPCHYLARIELLPQDFARSMEEETRTKIYDAFREIGFAYTALDIRGYRTGSMNEVLEGISGKAEETGTEQKD